MQRLRQGLGFLLAATAVWLLFVLAGQLSQEQVAYVQLLLLALAACAWAREGARSRPLLRMAMTMGLVGCVAGVAGVVTHSPSEQAGIPWQPFDLARAEALHAEGRPVFVNVTADWCFTCKINEQAVLQRPAVVQAFARHGITAMKADWTNRSDHIGSYLASFSRYGIPFYVLYPKDGPPRLLSELLTEEEVLTTLAAPSSPTKE
jgi:thiol:disulfide interchange protein